MKKRNGKQIDWKRLEEILKPIGIIITMLGVIVANIIFGGVRQEMDIQNNEREKLTEPIHYSISYIHANTNYSVHRGEEQIAEIPAFATRIEVTRGAIWNMTSIGYDGEEIYTKMSSSLSAHGRNGYYIDVELQLPDTPLLADNILYDYSFLYIQPIEGREELLLLYTAVDLKSGEVLGSHICNKLDLLKLELNEELPYAEGHMLKAYRELYDRIAEINEQLP